MHKDVDEESAPRPGGLGAVIQQAKDKKALEGFNRLVVSLPRMWLYQYIENFHCKPDSIEDMLNGIRYLIYSRKDK